MDQRFNEILEIEDPEVRMREIEDYNEKSTWLVE
jgi:hypothetical protein